MAKIKPYTPAKYAELSVLMRNLRAVLALDYYQCRKVYNEKKGVVLDNICREIAQTALR